MNVIAKKIFRSFVISMMESGSTIFPNFKAGLNYKLYKKIKETDISAVENTFKQMGVNSQFNGSKMYAAETSFVANIMDDISKKYNLPFDYYPSSIYVYRQKELNQPRKREVIGFVTYDEDKVIKQKPKFPADSLFLHKQIFESPVLLNFVASDEYALNFSSTPHFLHNIIHEWFHNIHLNKVCKQLGYDGNCPIFKNKYPHKNPMAIKLLDSLEKYTPPKATKSYCINNFGRYSCHKDSLLEFFAEAMTKFTVNSLDNDLNVVKNPLDNIPKDMPANLKKLIDVTLS